MGGPTLATLKRLYAFSGNRCAFPGCTLPIVEDSGIVTGIVCHIKGRSPGGPRYDSTQTSAERHGYENLVLMCARHSKLIDSSPGTYPAETLWSMKSAHEPKGTVELSPPDALKAEALMKEYKALHITANGNVILNSPGAVQADCVTINHSKASLKVLPAQGSLGSDVVRRNYVKHLIDRYNEFARKQPGRTEFTYAAIYGIIKRRFRAEWERIPLARFPDLVNLLYDRIDRTKLGRINRGKGIKNYSSFDEYMAANVGGVDGEEP